MEVRIKLEKLIYILSGAAFFILLAQPLKSSCLLYSCLGLLAGTALCVLTDGWPGGRSSLIIKLLAAVLGTLFLRSVSSDFFMISWKALQGGMMELLKRAFANSEKELQFLRAVLMVLAFPFVWRVFAGVLFFIAAAVKSVRLGDFWRELTSTFRRGGHGLQNSGMILLNLLLAVAAGTLLLVLVYLLPTEPIDSNVKKSAPIIREEDSYAIISMLFFSRLDNYTDSIMMLEAANDSPGSVLEKAMNVPRGAIDGKDPPNSLTGHYCDGIEYDSIRGYPRYWHGYLVFLKPILTVMDYSNIRILNGACQLLVLIWLCIVIGKRGYQRAMLPVVLMYLMLRPVGLSKSMQFSSCYYVLMFGSLAVLYAGGRIQGRSMVPVFLNIGIATAFFDFLTYPIATFGVPAAFFLLLGKADTAEKKLSGLVKNGLGWCVGYGGMWAMKWVLAGALTGRNVVADAVNTFAVRSSNAVNWSTGVEIVSPLSCVINNITWFFTTPCSVLILFLVFFLLCRGKRKDSFSTQAAPVFFPFFLLSFAPAVWYAFAVNHSIMHGWFTYRACVVMLLSLLFGATQVVEGPDVKKGESDG